VEQVRYTINKKSYALDEVANKKVINPNELLSKTDNNPILIIIEQLLLIIDNENKKNKNNLIESYYQILRITTSESGFIIMKHLLKYGSFIETELIESYGINKDKVHRTVSCLEKNKLIRSVGHVQIPYSKKAGKRAKIYLLDGAPPERSHDAQRRYAEILNARRDVKVNQTQLEEAFNLVKVYLEKRETNRVPEIPIIKRILTENEIKGVEIPLIVNRLRKEGYKW